MAEDMISTYIPDARYLISFSVGEFVLTAFTVQKSHYPPVIHHAIHLQNVLFPGHNHLLTTSADDSSLAGARAIVNVSGHQYQRL